MVSSNPTIDVVIPTIGRPSLAALVTSIARAGGQRPSRIIIVDDRRVCRTALDTGQLDPDMHARISIVSGTVRGPAAARNVGWRASHADWIAFLDDDVLVGDDWLTALDADLAELEPSDAASYGRVRVPLPANRPATDWERNVAGLATASWITADCAMRRSALLTVGGFDERFPRAYREDADIALRLRAAGKTLVRGERRAAHPVRPAPWWISVRMQRGNADDALMTALHGRGWRAAAGASHGTFYAHVATTGAALIALAAGAARRPLVARLAMAGWALQAGRFAWRRIMPGPRTPAEIITLVATSIVIPPAALLHRLVGIARLPWLLADKRRAPRPIAAAVLLDRDGTLIADVPYNADPRLVVPMPGALMALGRLRAAGVLTAIVSNQSGVGLGLLQQADVDAVNVRVEQLLGPLGPVVVCPHAPDDGCGCRKPRPGLIHAAARLLGVSPADCVVIGDIGADVEAATAAGARAVLVPTATTRVEEVAAAPLVAGDLCAAAELVLSGHI